MKRNKAVVEFKPEKIQRAIELAMKETELGVDSELSYEISKRIEDVAAKSGLHMEV